jgi:hypothetical protein
VGAASDAAIVWPAPTAAARSSAYNSIPAWGLWYRVVGPAAGRTVGRARAGAPTPGGATARAVCALTATLGWTTCHAD